MDDPRHLLRDYLRTRRAKLQPADVGLIGGGMRRVAGLRREEVASLAGVNVDYYARLEQGRLPNVSLSVLDAVARALRLDPAERQHLIDLARPANGRNLARFIFLDPEARTIHSDWAAVAEEAVATLRHDAGQHPNDPQLPELIHDLAQQSPEFARWWAGHDVRSLSNGSKTYRHPQMGEITVHCEALEIPGDHQRLCIYTAEPGTPSQQALLLLAALRRPDAAARTAAGKGVTQPR
ncbi:helix-turn-helix transcriptional regulator [Subtercola endophyticus]|uniref:helix-turn-helix transcriptional regulator n=1 Tax=Subtercola endophyticus TaxID=2895559 RepID=UPI001E36F1CC|nr:helix-turn-helix transcriptional regulator [Subtercola endophyticus]UFS59435.1 helix-turn-helix transcriptional regulator [Subtercola endophyticus]